MAYTTLEKWSKCWGWRLIAWICSRPLLLSNQFYLDPHLGPSVTYRVPLAPKTNESYRYIGTCHRLTWRRRETFERVMDARSIWCPKQSYRWQALDQGACTLVCKKCRCVAWPSFTRQNICFISTNQWWKIREICCTSKDCQFVIREKSW